MKIKCNRCGKKYKDLYMQCPHCGEMRRDQVTYRDQQVVVREEDLYTDFYKEQEEQVQPGQERRDKPLKPLMAEGERQGVSQSVPSSGRPKKKKVKKLRWIVLGLGAAFLWNGIAYGIQVYRDNVNPKELSVERLKPGDMIETARGKVKLHKAQKITDEWLESYIPSAYELIGIYGTGSHKEEEDPFCYASEYYISYEKDGLISYEPTVDDSRVVDYFRDHLGGNTLSTYNSYYGDESGYMLFIVPKGTTSITFNYTHMLHSNLRDFYKGTTYEIPFVIEGGALENGDD